MKEIARIKNEKFYNRDAKAAEVKAALAAIKEADKLLGVLEEKVAPYGYYIPMREIIDSVRDWNKCTYDSRAVLIAELNGCIDIINHKIQLYNEKDVVIRIIVGKNTGLVKTVKETVANDFVAIGLAELA